MEPPLEPSPKAYSGNQLLSRILFQSSTSGVELIVNPDPGQALSWTCASDDAEGHGLAVRAFRKQRFAGALVQGLMPKRVFSSRAVGYMGLETTILQEGCLC